MNRTQSKLRAEKAEETVRAKGEKAYRDGEPRTACPYKDHRQSTGKLTWSRAWAKLWHKGYDEGEATRCVAAGCRQRALEGAMLCKPHADHAQRTMPS